MRKIKIRKSTDFDISINRDFELVIENDLNEVCSYPIVISNQLQVEVPEYMYTINDFLQNKREKLLKEDALTFLKLAKINLTPFIWELMKDIDLDFYINSYDLYIRSGDIYVVLNNRNIDLNIIDKLYKVQTKPHIGSTYKECMDELYTFIRNKISNSIGHNEFVNIQMKNYKDTEMELEKECQSDTYDFPKILVLYEKLIRIKENFLNENHYLMPQSEIDEIYNILQQIRALLKSSQSYKYNVERM